MIKVLENESFPADLVMLSTSEDNGSAYINTMNLDGETNLKEKMALVGTRF